MPKRTFKVKVTETVTREFYVAVPKVDAAEDVPKPDPKAKKPDEELEARRREQAGKATKAEAEREEARMAKEAVELRGLATVGRVVSVEPAQVEIGPAEREPEKGDDVWDVEAREWRRG